MVLYGWSWANDPRNELEFCCSSQGNMVKTRSALEKEIKSSLKDREYYEPVEEGETPPAVKRWECKEI